MNTGAVYDKNDRNTFPSGRGEWPLLVVVDDGVHHVHHGFGGTEDGDDGVEPGVALVVLGYHAAKLGQKKVNCQGIW